MISSDKMLVGVGGLLSNARKTVSYFVFYILGILKNSYYR